MTAETSPCPRCRTHWHIDETIVLGDYGGLLRDLVIRAKREVERPLAFALGNLLSATAPRHWRKASAVIPVPVHWIRFLIRGSHSAEAMGAAFAKQLGLSQLTRQLTCTRLAPKQGMLTPRQRKQNVKRAFRCRRLEGSIILVDDVLTTGATLNAAARTLKQAGASKVYAAIAARSPR